MNKFGTRMIFPALAAGLLALGCSSSTPTATPTSAPVPTPTATATATAIPAPTATSTSIPIVATATPEGALPSELFLEITEPADESIVSQPTVTVRGLTTPDAIVSVGGQTIDVDAQGEFAVVITLEPGPNIIEMVASNLEGMEESGLISLLYIP